MRTERPEEIDLIKNVCEMFIKQLPRMIAYLEGIEKEIDGIKFENELTRKLLLETECKLHDTERQLHELKVLKNPASEI